MTRRPTIVFLDIDGVLSIADPLCPELRYELWPGCGPAWPVPFADALLRALDQDPHLRPVWLTYWERRAWRWNDRAGTAHWPVAFPLSSAGLHAARQAIAPLDETQHLDKKLLAVWAYLRRRSRHHALWIEDGFWPETMTWVEAHAHNLRLVDATRDDIYAILIAEHADPTDAARAFLRACLAERQPMGRESPATPRNELAYSHEHDRGVCR